MISIKLKYIVLFICSWHQLFPQCDEDFRLSEKIEPKICVESLLYWFNEEKSLVNSQYQIFADRNFVRIAKIGDVLLVEVMEDNPNKEDIYNEIQRQLEPFLVKETHWGNTYKFTAFVDGENYEIKTTRMKSKYYIRVKKKT